MFSALPAHNNSRHHGLNDQVNMDPSSHSVFLSGGIWQGYTGANPNGNDQGGCYDSETGPLPDGCVSLDIGAFDLRINCVQYVPGT